MKKLKIGLIGAGFIGSLHARIYHENPNVELIAIADTNKKLADEFAQIYGCKSYEDYNAMLQNEDIDAVDICVPEDYHVMPAVAAANAKKHIFIEKPIAKTKKEAEEIMEAVNKNGVRIMVGHVLKFDPRYVQLKEAIESDKLGTISTLALKRINSIATPNRLRGKVSFFYYLGIHDIEWLLDYNSGAQPTKVYAQANSIVNKGLDYDAAFLIINFDNGSIATLELNWAYPENGICGFKSTAEVVGTKGVGVVNVENQGLLIATRTDVELPDALHWPEYNGKIRGDLREEIDHYVQATLRNEDYLVGTELAITAVGIIEAAMESIRTGLPIELDDRYI